MHPYMGKKNCTDHKSLGGEKKIPWGKRGDARSSPSGLCSRDKQKTLKKQTRKAGAKREGPGK